MNASALLKAQGWRGEGHTLHATNDSIGLKNRLLVSRKGKDNTSGLGASSAVNDQWWLSALDEQLSGLETKNGKVVQTLKNGKLDRLNDTAGKSELYKFFVSGGILQGSLDYLKKETETGSDTNKPPTTDSKLRTITMTVKQMHIETETTSSSSEASSKQRGTKEERRARKEERRLRRERKQARREARKQKSSATSTDADDSTDLNNATKAETKEERRARREARRKRKEEKRRTKR
ncbi:uncharacterized protein DNG_04937 [Cephalotrichum gorgonifer]|uniref:G-patch domain-containing protein n=1 Tax=Cephalotrichum gorgonifer TaxID=2041049 RepID=A0AAE8SVC2_9PEZI|nr:uncharacterized protein DNG_04937 [Cephalotrichum gorgonifer]